MFAKEIRFIEDHDRLVEDPARLAAIREDIRGGDVYVAKRVFPKDLLVQIRNYLTQIGRCSLPNYCKIEKGCPNFHRINRWDSRAYVRGCFHQFSFFPWNQDLFDFFETFKSVYYVKNALSGLPPDRFLDVEPQDGCTARLSFQFYPRGMGGLNMHSDPIDYHQLTVPIMIMSQKGEEFQQGGAYVVTESGQRIILDDFCGYGDVVYFQAQCRHGVERIDPDIAADWLSFQGRWMLLFAVNKLANNQKISDAVDFEKSHVAPAEPAAAASV